MDVEGPIAIGKITNDKRILAHQLKDDETEAEKVLWRYLRANRLCGIPFRRQTAIRGFIVDFYAPRYKKVVEADGGVHGIQSEYDRERTEILNQLGIDVIRFSNDQIMSDIASVLKAICESCGLSFTDDQWLELERIEETGL
jgi:very-short-patch-repair endonuclease